MYVYGMDVYLSSVFYTYVTSPWQHHLFIIYFINLSVFFFFLMLILGKTLYVFVLRIIIKNRCDVTCRFRCDIYPDIYPEKKKFCEFSIFFMS